MTGNLNMNGKRVNDLHSETSQTANEATSIKYFLSLINYLSNVYNSHPNE